MNSLFDETPGFDRERLKHQLAALAQNNIFIGGSSWKYEGWLGQIYDRSRYQVRGRFSKRVFEDTCLEEYATVFHTVCGDFAFYQFPTTEFWAKLFAQVPSGFQFALKAPEQLTRYTFANHPRYDPQGGSGNPAFLDIDLFRESFARPLEAYRDKVTLIIFEFGAFAPSAFHNVVDFLDRLDPFLSRLPKCFRYAVEIRNAEFLTSDYFACLHSHNLAHVYNSWTRMPLLQDQIAISDSLTSDVVVARALLKQGRPYEDAVERFSPYRDVQEVNQPVRDGLRELLQIARDGRRTAFIFINNRLEGNAPGTIVSILDD